MDEHQTDEKNVLKVDAQEYVEVVTGFKICKSVSIAVLVIAAICALFGFANEEVIWGISVLFAGILTWALLTGISKIIQSNLIIIDMLDSVRKNGVGQDMPPAEKNQPHAGQ